ncbi:DUF3068 domain-containing protein [uncultured Corynebacterium sp.]|uniref:DUF3068 domain-containing protein n=1 Tax=uncultured Corynebacterium sp. TaxID=159447 RepID=UPI0025E83842|nr:DUF3068 domain-containing protein [uncultured Corynebacterium sp.]
MLPASRVLSSLLLGVGVAGVAAGVAVPSFINEQPSLPLNLEDTTWTITDENASTRLVQDGRQINVPVTAQWHVALQEPADEDTVTLRVGSSWMRSSQQAEADRLIQAEVLTYPMDRLTGEATGDGTLTHTLGSPTTNVAMSGVWFKFPSNAQKTTYDVYDDTLRGTAPAVFESETELDGRTVYVYHQDVEPTNIAKRYAGTFTTIAHTNDAGEEERGYLYHSASRDFYVDAQTGLVVDMDVSIKDFYGTDAGDELENALTFTGSISEDDTAHFLAETKKFHHPALIDAIRWGLIGAGALLSLIALIGVFGGVSRSRRG